VYGHERPLIASVARPRPLALVESSVNHQDTTKTRSGGGLIVPGGSTTIAPWSWLSSVLRPSTGARVVEPV
jgi:hypothetical protein